MPTDLRDLRDIVPSCGAKRKRSFRGWDGQGLWFATCDCDVDVWCLGRSAELFEERAARDPASVPHVRALAVSDQVEVRQAGAVALGADELTSPTPGKLSHLSCRAADEHAR